MDAIVVRRMSGGPILVIEDAAAVAEAFFTLDASTVGPDSYDAWAGRSDPNRITTADVSAMNRTMRARSPHAAWAKFTNASMDLEPLAAIDRRWSLFELEPDAWAEREVSDRLTALMLAVRGPYRNVAVMTKVLYLKRPALIPVLDSLIAHQVGATPGTTAIALIEHLREEGRRNLDVLRATQIYLAGVGIERTLVRILDVLLWTTHPAAGLAPRLDGWEHRFGRTAP